MRIGSAGRLASPASRFSPFLLLGIALGLLIGPGAASAEDIHTTPSGEYGKEALATSGTGSSCRIAYQESEKRLYLMSDAKIYALEITGPGTAAIVPGYPINPGLGNNFYCSNTDIEVDNTGGSSDGRFYTTVGGSEITAFNPDGTRVGSPWPAITTYLCSTAVLPDGEVFGYSQFPQPPTISRFSAAGEPLKSIPFTEGGCPQMAIDPTDSDLYASNGYQLKRYTAASNYQTSTPIAAPVSQYGDYRVNGALHKIYVANGSSIDVYDTETAEKLESFPTGEEVRSLALVESTDTVLAQVGSGGEGRIKEFPPHVVPDVKTVSASGEGLVEGSVEALSNGPVTACRVEWGPEAKQRAEAYEHSLPCSPAVPYAQGSTTAVTAQLTGLVGETTYHYRVIASNSTGSGYGADRTFVPHYVQNVVTEACSAVTTSSATLNASFLGNGDDTHYFFEWGLAGKPFEHTTPTMDAGSPNVQTQVSEPISGLSSDTGYHYRVVMYNSKGESPGNEVACASENAVQSLETEPVTNLTSSSVTLNSSWNGNGHDTHYYFEWGFSNTSGYEHSSPDPAADGGSASGPQTHSVNLSNLVANAGYRYRVVAVSDLGTSYGANQTFKTFQFPTVEYLQPTEYEPESVTLNASVNPNGGGETTFHYDYGLTSSYGSSTAESTSIGSDSNAHLASANIGGLAPGTTYHYRIVATGPGGSYVSPDDQTVTTLPVAPSITDSSITERTPSSARINAEVRPGFGATVVYFEYGQSEAYGSTTVPGPALAADNAPHPVVADLAGLLPDTTYHYKVVAINFNGSATSADRVFTTGGLPRVGAESASGITETTASVAATINPNLTATAYRIEYGPTSAFGSSTATSAAIGSDDGDHPIAGTLTGLAPGTTYHYRVVATNGIGTTSGEEATFTTAKAKVAPPPPACRKGFVKKHGRCVKKPRKKKRKHSKRNKGRKAGGR